MLNREGNANSKKKKKKKGLISKKQHTFLYNSLPLFCPTKTWDFLVTHLTKEMSYVWSVCLPSFLTLAQH